MTIVIDNSFQIFIKTSSKVDWDHALYLGRHKTFDEAIARAKEENEGMSFEYWVRDVIKNKNWYGYVGRYRYNG